MLLYIDCTCAACRPELALRVSAAARPQSVSYCNQLLGPNRRIVALAAFKLMTSINLLNLLTLCFHVQITNQAVMQGKPLPSPVGVYSCL